MSVSQLCDNGMRVIFEATKCTVEDMSSRKTIFHGKREGNVYVVYLEDLEVTNLCLAANVATRKPAWPDRAQGGKEKDEQQPKEARIFFFEM